MKNSLSAFFFAATVVAACVGVLAQEKSAPTPAPSAQSQSQQSPELAEASQLGREVVQLYTAGKFEEALPKAERALAIREKILGASDAAVADALTNVAAIQAALKNPDRARDAYERAETIYETKLGADAEKTNNLREILGWSFYRKGNNGKAEALFQSLLESRERMLGAQHAKVADALAGLAAVYLANGDAASRDRTYSRLLDIVEKMPEPLPKNISKVLEYYVCTSPDSPRSSAKQKEIEDRIRTPRGLEPGKEQSIEGGVLNGRALSKPVPEYPPGARQARVQGTVVVKIVVDENGRVTEANAMCGPPPLFAASEEAARHARFTPTLLSGQPVKVSGTISYHFTLQ